MKETEIWNQRGVFNPQRESEVCSDAWDWPSDWKLGLQIQSMVLLICHLRLKGAQGVGSSSTRELLLRVGRWGPGPEGSIKPIRYEHIPGPQEGGPEPHTLAAGGVPH